MGNKNMKHMKPIDMILIENKRIVVSYRFTTNYNTKRLYIDKYILHKVDTFTILDLQNGEHDFLQFYDSSYKSRGLKIRKLNSDFYKTLSKYLEPSILEGWKRL